MSLRDLTPAQERVLIRVLKSYHLQNLIGGEEWDLTEAEEMILWEIIKSLDKS
jgi:hypothetical protein